MNIGRFVGAAALGVGALYLFDPVRGEERRQKLRSKSVELLHAKEEAFGLMVQDFGERTREAYDEAKSKLLKAHHDGHKSLAETDEKSAPATADVGVEAVAGELTPAACLAMCVMGSYLLGRG